MTGHQPQTAPLCIGCRHPIDTRHGNLAVDPNGRPWHTQCLTTRVTVRMPPVRPVREATVFDAVLWLACWPWALARLAGRHNHWEPWQENLVGIIATIAVLAVALAILTAAQAP